MNHCKYHRAARVSHISFRCTPGTPLPQQKRLIRVADAAIVGNIRHFFPFESRKHYSRDIYCRRCIWTEFLVVEARAFTGTAPRLDFDLASRVFDCHAHYCHAHDNNITHGTAIRCVICTSNLAVIHMQARLTSGSW